MRYCIIGIHSDSIVMEIKESSGTQNAEQSITKEHSLGLENKRGFITLHREVHPLPLESYMQGQSMNPKGQECLLQCVEKLISHEKQLLCDEAFCFATSILRYASNRQEITYKLKEKLGIDLEVLTGVQQCMGGFRETMAVSHRTSGIGCQIGGGSTQIFLFSEGRLEQCTSLPVGHGRLYNKYVSSVLPNYMETESIRRETLDLMDSCDFLKKQTHRTLFMLGDCCEKAVKLALSVSGNMEYGKSCSIYPKDFRLIYTLLRSRNMNGTALLERMFPESVTTLFPAMIIMETIGRRCGAEEQVVLKTSMESDFFHQKMEQLIHNAN